MSWTLKIFNDNRRKNIFHIFLYPEKKYFYFSNEFHKQTQITGLDSQMIGSLNGETDDKIGSSLHKSFGSSYLGDIHTTVEYKCILTGM